MLLNPHPPPPPRQLAPNTADGTTHCLRHRRDHRLVVDRLLATASSLCRLPATGFHTSTAGLLAFPRCRLPPPLPASRVAAGRHLLRAL
ncbi:hypothetical protein E2562_016722 [Oryza meyeriana var. granulata]|uniref:Uncharacterized protein n=1 Tax=Oryza meyeriana var. granulata TaxID=110450 RepID=A0A6G1BVP7_9ORYZ|nr:hypothetical protein E2562_016722 [Oryza meyeriana var. granulata]